MTEDKPQTTTSSFNIQNPSFKIDYIIVGQGLSGAVLAYLLLQKGKKVIVFDDENRIASSSVAAGIFNPVTGKRLVKTWLADELFPVFVQFYRDLENQFEAKFLYDSNVYRPFVDIAEQNTFLARSNSQELENYVEEEKQSNQYKQFIFNDLGGIKIKKSGWVDVPLVLEKLKKYFQEKGIFVNEKFDFEKLSLTKKQIKYQEQNVEKIIFCEGVYARQNPFFNWLPFNPAKGEILNLKIEDYPIQEIVNQGVFILNQENGTCKVGSTYKWDNLNNEITTEGKTFLEEKLSKLLKSKYEILQQKAGVRPSTKDRRPFVGSHPEHPELVIFNGMGSKGTSLIPYFAIELINFLEKNIQIQPEANIERFYSLYFGRKQ
jgi:glycine/D-amino acid oxidase-like deaminating enzyme